MAKQIPFSRGPGIVASALHSLVSQIPPSVEVPSANPDERAKSLAKVAAWKAAAISGSFTLPPGPLGMATVLPDLLAVWRIQQQLVADIARAFGKTSALTAETMVISLFKHGGAALTRPLFARQDQEVVVQRIANRTLLQLLEKIAIRVVQRIAAKSVSRWMPVLGALGAGAYAYYDTTHVAGNAIDLFSQNLRISPDPLPDEPPAASAKPVRKRTRSAGTTKGGHEKKEKPNAPDESADAPRKTPPRSRQRSTED